MSFDKSPLLSGGALRLQQTRTMSTSDVDGSIIYKVESRITDMVDFSPALTNLKPNRPFVMINSAFVRIATINDFQVIPADHPEVPAEGEWRSHVVTREFSDPSEALAWSAFVARSLNALHIKLKDYSAVLENASEEAWIPLTATQDIYEKMREYMQISETVREAQAAKERVRAQMEILNIALDKGKVFGPALITGEVATINSLDFVEKSISDMIADAADTASVTNPASQLAFIALQLPTQLFAVRNNLASLGGLNSGGTEGLPKVTKAFQTINLPELSYAISQLNEEIGEGSPSDYVVKANAAIARTYNTLLGNANELERMSSMLSGGSESLNQVATSLDSVTSKAADMFSLTEQINRVSEINVRTLNVLAPNLEAEHKRLSDQLEALLRTKNKIGAELRELLGDEFDPDFPMSFFNYRIFRTRD